MPHISVRDGIATKVACCRDSGPSVYPVGLQRRQILQNRRLQSLHWVRANGVQYVFHILIQNASGVVRVVAVAGALDLVEVGYLPLFFYSTNVIPF